MSDKAGHSQTPAIGSPPAAYLDPSAPRVKWTVPAFELRRLIEEAHDLGETFMIQYTVLEGQIGSERWRKRATGRTVTLVEDGKGDRTCNTTRLSDLEEAVSCVCSQCASLPPPSFILRKILVQQPYPIIDEDSDAESNIICFGP